MPSSPASDVFLQAFKRGKQKGSLDRSPYELALESFNYKEDPLRPPTLDELATLHEGGDVRLARTMEAIGEAEYDVAPWILCIHAPEGTGKSLVASYAYSLLSSHLDEENMGSLEKVNHLNAIQAFQSTDMIHQWLKHHTLSELSIVDNLHLWAKTIVKGAIQTNLHHSNLQLVLFLRTREYRHVALSLYEDGFLASDLEKELYLLKLPSNTQLDWLRHYSGRLQASPLGSPLETKLLQRIIHFARGIPGLINSFLKELFKRAFLEGSDVITRDHWESFKQSHNLSLIDSIAANLKENGSTRAQILRHAITSLASEQQGLTYEELIQATHLAKSSLHHHLRRLTEDEILIRQKRGRRVVYFLRDDIAPLLEASVASEDISLEFP